MDRQPTDEEKRKFWEWCADEIEHFAEDKHRHYRFGTEWVQNEPPIDLNNLSRYAIPKLTKTGYSYELIGWNEGQHKAIIINKTCKGWARILTTKIGKDPALALFWATEPFWNQEVIEES